MRDLDRITQLRAALWAAGYPPVAVLSAHYPTATGAGKRPQGKAWQDRARLEVPEAVLQAPSMDALNTGILCDGLRAVDLDVEDPEKIKSLLMFAEMHLGVAPVRHRANSARLLLLYRAAEGEPGKRSVTAPDGQKVEVLGYGQQFVAAGLHPTGAVIKWKPDEKGGPWKGPLPWTGSLPKRAQLTAVTEEKVGFFLEEASMVIGAPPEGRRPSRPLNEQTNARASTPPPAIPLDVVDAIMSALPNGPEFSDRGRWLAMGHAIASAYANDLDRGRAAWMDWCEKWTGGVADDEHADRTWDSLGDEHQADVRFILAAARRARVNLRGCGYTPSEVICVAAEDEFEATDEVPLSPGAPKPGVATECNALPQPTARARFPDLLVQRSDIPATTRALGQMLSRVPDYFESPGLGRAVRVRVDEDGLPRVREPSFREIVHLAHEWCRPVGLDRKGEVNPVSLPQDVAKMYLDEINTRKLRPLRGTAACPLIDRDGSIRSVDGYDDATGLYCVQQPELDVPVDPTKQEAARALLTVREVFSGFPTGGERKPDIHGVAHTDLGHSPQYNESALIHGLMTAVTRASLDLAPGFLITAPALNGAGTGKGLASRAICMIAYGSSPCCITPGLKDQETEARIVGELLEQRSVLWVDNLNSRSWRSDTLASILTEGKTSQRPLGTSAMVELKPKAFIILNGNALGVSEDLVSRFITCRFDAGMESPEARRFDPGYLEKIRARRAELLSACLTIVRWGLRQKDLPRGAGCRYEMWASFVRDPLLALGCADPIEKVEADKALDPQRQHMRDILRTWWEAHGSTPMKARKLADTVKMLLWPYGSQQTTIPSDQIVAPAVQKLVGVHLGGFSCERTEKKADYETATYVVRYDGPPLEPAEAEEKDNPYLGFDFLDPEGAALH